MSTIGLRWTDVHDVAIALACRKHDVNPLSVNFVDLRKWILDLPEFDDNPEHCGEKILEAIQMAWIEESDDYLPANTRPTNSDKK